MAFPSHIENMQRLEALENVLFPKCARCKDKMSPVSMRYERAAGGEHQVTLWECGACERLMEETKTLRVVYRINDISEPDVIYNESQAHKKEQEERRIAASTLDAAFVDQEKAPAQV